MRTAAARVSTAPFECRDCPSEHRTDGTEELDEGIELLGEVVERLAIHAGIVGSANRGWLMRSTQGGGRVTSRCKPFKGNNYTFCYKSHKR